MNNDERYIFTKDNTYIAKSVAIILMFIHHLFAFPNRLLDGVTYVSCFLVGGNTPIEFYVGEFGKICVSMFMVLSGYGTYLSLLTNKNSITYFIYNKIKHLYLIYWKVFIIFIPIGMCLGVKRIEKDVGSILYNFSALKISYNGEWWFLTPFIMTLILLPLIKQWLDRKNAEIGVDIFIIISFTIIINRIIPNIMKLDFLSDFNKTLYWSILYSTLKLIPQFLIGCIIAKYDLFTGLRKKIKNNVLIYALSIVTIILVFYLRKKNGSLMDVIYAPLFILAITSIIQDIRYVSDLLIRLNKRSTEMWLIHSFFCYHFCQKLIFSPKLSILILLLLIIISYASAWLIEYVFSCIKRIIRSFILKQQN